MTITLKRDESRTITYENKGVQEEIMFDISEGYPLNGSVRVVGGSSDVFDLETKIGDNWESAISSSNGIIPDLTISGKGKGIRLNITDNVSGDIKLEILL